MSVRGTLLGLSAALVAGSFIYLAVAVKAAPVEGSVSESSKTVAANKEFPSKPALGDPSTAGNTAEAIRDKPPRTGRAGAAGRAAKAARDRAVGVDRRDTLGANADDDTPALRERAQEVKPPTDPTGSRGTEASALYDRRDYDGALSLARAVLASEPDNVSMLRIVVSAGCAMGDVEVAKEYFEKLKAKDQRDMTRRCEGFGTIISSESLPPR